MTIATRSPFLTPSAIRRAANRATARRCASNVTRSSSFTMYVRSGKKALNANTSASVGGAFFQVLMRTPRISRSSTSRSDPGVALSRWCACSIDMAGKPAGRLGASVVMTAFVP
jgi:hypothetical protein